MPTKGHKASLINWIMKKKSKGWGSCSFRFKVFLRHLAHKIKAKNMNTIATAFYYFQALKE